MEPLRNKGVSSPQLYVPGMDLLKLLKVPLEKQRILSTKLTGFSKTMLYSLCNTPKHFEDLIVGHFCEHAPLLLEACKAYIKGVHVGLPVESGVQAETNIKRRQTIYWERWYEAKDFKTSLRIEVASLVPTLIKIN